MCSSAAVEGLPITLSLMLRRIYSEDEIPLPSLSPFSPPLCIYAQREDGAGVDAVQLAISGSSLLKVTVNLAAFPGRLPQLSAADATAAKHVWADQFWCISSRFRFSTHLRARARAEWPVPRAPQWREESGGRLIRMPCGRPGDDDDSADLSSVREGCTTRYKSASQSPAPLGQPSSLYDRSTLRSQLKGPVYIDQALFPIVRILFVSELYTEAIPTATAVLRNMTVQVSVERCRESRSGKPIRRAPRDCTTKENVVVLDRVPESSSHLHEESKALLEPYQAICLAFNAHVCQPSKTSAIAYDVAYAKRLVVEGYAFEVLVTGARMKGKTLETVSRALQAYQYERNKANVLNMDLDEVASSIAEWFGYMKEAPSAGLMSFHHVVWEAMRIYMLTGVISNAFENDQDDEFNDCQDRINNILMDVRLGYGHRPPPLLRTLKAVCVCGKVKSTRRGGSATGA
ncbi:hypothetical protein JIQ42_02994 [Leishmania sp. Namibia]|uniref:hypothetical protein n=1 Tax=Leishmania sp. Namibia TaxID=2802991 RepID=UPI001B65EA55|nr:hypothetical protein JIQ42_02994 [Leishmania sp. Namibia]